MTHALGVGTSLHGSAESLRIRHVEAQGSAAVGLGAVGKRGSDVVGPGPPERSLHVGCCTATSHLVTQWCWR